MGCDVGELVRPRHVAAGVDIGVERLQVVVGFDRARAGGRNAELLESVARRVGDATHGAEQEVERDAHFLPFVLGDEHFLAVVDQESLRCVAGKDSDAFDTEALRHHLRDVRILPRQDARQHLDLGHLRAEAREALRELGADGPAAKHQQPLRQFPQ